MKYKKLLARLVLACLLPMNFAVAEFRVPFIRYELGDVIPEKTIDYLIARYATGTKAYQMKRTLYCESIGFQNIQSLIVKDGVQEDSWGIAQINLYWNEDITKEQALDPELSIKWMSEHWENTKWYGYIRKTDKCSAQK